MKKCALYLILATLLSCSGDGADDSSRMLGPGETPVNPRPTPSSSASSRPRSPWTSASIYVSYCDTPKCAGFEGFTVTRAGNYYSASGKKPGMVSMSELQSLSSAAQALAATDLTQSTCVTQDPLPGAPAYAVDLRTEDGASSTVFDNLLRPHACTHGDFGKAVTLSQIVYPLAQKYATVGPDPSPSPSHEW